MIFVQLDAKDDNGYAFASVFAMETSERQLIVVLVLPPPHDQEGLYFVAMLDVQLYSLAVHRFGLTKIYYRHPLYPLQMMMKKTTKKGNWQ